ncbi:hypothetical protein V3N99_18585 [Dermatophilaceae bacterium Soc4.6]
MSEKSTTGAKSTGEGTGRRWGWLIPGVTFLVGIVLGGLVVFAQQSGQDTASSGGSSTPSRSVTATPTDSSSSSAVAVVRVPKECLTVADDSQALVDVATGAVTAARNLDAAALADAVRQLDAAQKAVTASAAACRQVQASLPTVTSTDAATTTPGG